MSIHKKQPNFFPHVACAMKLVYLQWDLAATLGQINLWLCQVLHPNILFSTTYLKQLQSMREGRTIESCRISQVVRYHKSSSWTSNLVVLRDDPKSVLGFHDDEALQADLRRDVGPGHLDVSPVKVCSADSHRQRFVGQSRFPVTQVGQKFVHVTDPEPVHLLEVVKHEPVSRQLQKSEFPALKSGQIFPFSSEMLKKSSAEEVYD